jgi:SEC-C motif
MRSVGRNDPCPCGIGKKYKKCHLRSDEQARAAAFAPQPMPPEIAAALIAVNEEQRVWVERYGHVRPIISAVYHGKRFVGVGHRLLWGDFETVPSALDAYLGALLGKEWVEAQRAKPLADRHVLLQWRHQFVESMKAARSQNPDAKIITTPATGASSSYLFLAWDLFSLDAFGKLQEQFVKRLKSADQFQGVRHELFALATCVRAGFEIEHHPASAKAQSQTECNAVDRKTGQRITVEAKSRHRHRVLGFSGGTPKDYADMRTEVVGLLADAFRKPVADPYVIFLDLNLPPDPSRQIEWMREIGDSVDPAKLKAGLRPEDPDPFTFLVITNYPMHYKPSAGVEEAHRTEMFALAKRLPASLKHPSVIGEIQRAVEKFGQIPDRFQETSRVNNTAES